MKGDKNEESQEVNNKAHHLAAMAAKAESEGMADLAGRKEKALQDFEIYKQPDKIIKNSSSYNNSLLTKFEPSKADVFSHKGVKNTRDYRQELTFLSDGQSKQFIAYCIINKQSNSGMVSHERLLVLHSRTKVIEYFSKIPQLPVRTFEEINEQPKESINIVTSQKFTITVLKSGIGEVQISWIQSGKPQKWKIKMGNSHIVRDFCMLVDNVKKGKHLEEKIQISRTRPPEVKVNSKKTNFIADIKRLEEKQSLNQSILSKIQPPKREEVSQNDMFLNQVILQADFQGKNEDILLPITTENKVQKQALTRIQLPETIVKASTDLLRVPASIQLSGKESVQSIKIEQIIKKVEQDDRDKRKQQIPPNTPTFPQLTSKQYVTPSPRHSEIQRILKNRRILDQNEDDSIATIKHQNRELEMLGMSKLLVKNIHRKPTNKQEFQTSQKQKQKVQTPQRYYRTEQPQKLNIYRDNLLQERRLTQFPSAQTKQRKTHILNQHSHPRQQKSRSRSKNKENSLPGLLIEREWLLKWVNAQGMQQRAEIYCKFVDHCKTRVQKLADGFNNWHMFHKEPEEYIIKQHNIEYTYQMLNINERDELSAIHERQMLQKMSNLDYVWKTINLINSRQCKYAVPLACLINYKSLKVFCKVQLASDSLLIEQIHDESGHRSEIKALQQALKGSLRYCSLFYVTSNQAKCIYIHDADILPMLNLQRGLTLSYSYIYNQIKNSQQFDEDTILSHLNKTLIPSFIDALDQAQIVSSKDFEQILEVYHLNKSLMGLIYQKSLQVKAGQARKLIISQIFASFLQLEVRQRVHSFLMKKQSNKSLNIEIFHIIAKTLRWRDDDSRLGDRIETYLGANLDDVRDELIDEYIIASLFMKLSLECHLKSIYKLEVLEQKQFSFWRECEFEQESMVLTFTPEVVAYDHRYFNDRNKQMQEILSKTPSSQMSESDFQRLKQFLTNKKGVSYSDSCYYRVLPPELRCKIDCYQQFCHVFRNNQSVKGNPSHKAPSNNYYLTKHCLEISIYTIKRLIRVRRYDDAENLVRTELVRAWIWCKNSPYPLISLYSLYSLLNLEKYSPNALSECLRSLQLSITHYQRNAISEPFLMEKTFKAAEIHTLFGNLLQALHLYRACSQIFEKMLQNSEVHHESLVKYMTIYTCSASILIGDGKVEEGVGEIKRNLARFGQWKEGLKQARYELMAKVYCQEFENYLLLLRCYELQGKRAELLQVAEEVSVKFIENYISIMLAGGKQLDSSYIPVYRFREVVKIIWHALVLNSSGKKITYHQYFSKVYSQLKPISLQSIRDIISAIREDCKGVLPFLPEQAIQKLTVLLHAAMPTNKLEKLCAYSMDSLFVEICIRCLTALSSRGFLEGGEEQEEENSKQLQLLSCLVSLAGYEFTLGAIEACSEGDY